jgi:hypothetical protein
MDRIDDEYDAANKAFPEKPEDTTLELGLRVAAPLIPLVGVFKELREHFSQKAVNQRFQALHNATNRKIDAVMRHLSAEAKTAAEDIVRERMNSTEFNAAVRESCVRALLTTEEEKIGRFGAVLGGIATQDDLLKSASDGPSYIRAVAELGETDIQTLSILRSVFADVYQTYPNLHDPNPFTERFQDLIKSSRDAGFYPDDFYSYCRRLEGFGLAMEVPRNPSRMAPGDYCFRATLRGLKLLALIEK